MGGERGNRDKSHQVEPPLPMNELVSTKNKTVYGSVYFDDVLYETNDCVDLYAGPGEKPYIGLIDTISVPSGADPSDIDILIRWFYRWEDIECAPPAGIKRSAREYLYSFHTDTNHVHSFERKFAIKYIGSDDPIPTTGIYCRFVYDHHRKEVIPLDGDIISHFVEEPTKHAEIQKILNDNHIIPKYTSQKRKKSSNFVVSTPTKVHKTSRSSKIHTRRSNSTTSKRKPVRIASSSSESESDEIIPRPTTSRTIIKKTKPRNQITIDNRKRTTGKTKRKASPKRFEPKEVKTAVRQLREVTKPKKFDDNFTTTFDSDDSTDDDEVVLSKAKKKAITQKKKFAATPKLGITDLQRKTLERTVRELVTELFKTDSASWTNVRDEVKEMLAKRLVDSTGHDKKDVYSALRKEVNIRYRKNEKKLANENLWKRKSKMEQPPAPPVTARYSDLAGLMPKKTARPMKNSFSSYERTSLYAPPPIDISEPIAPVEDSYDFSSTYDNFTTPEEPPVVQNDYRSTSRPSTDSKRISLSFDRPIEPPQKRETGQRISPNQGGVHSTHSSHSSLFSPTAPTQLDTFGFLPDLTLPDPFSNSGGQLGVAGASDSLFDPLQPFDSDINITTTSHRFDPRQESGNLFNDSNLFSSPAQLLPDPISTNNASQRENLEKLASTLSKIVNGRNSSSTKQSDDQRSSFDDRGVKTSDSRSSRDSRDSRSSRDSHRSGDRNDERFARRNDYERDRDRNSSRGSDRYRSDRSDRSDRDNLRDSRESRDQGRYGNNDREKSRYNERDRNGRDRGGSVSRGSSDRRESSRSRSSKHSPPQSSYTRSSQRDRNSHSENSETTKDNEDSFLLDFSKIEVLKDEPKVEPTVEEKESYKELKHFLQYIEKPAAMPQLESNVSKWRQCREFSTISDFLIRAEQNGYCIINGDVYAPDCSFCVPEESYKTGKITVDNKFAMMRELVLLRSELMKLNENDEIEDSRGFWVRIAISADKDTKSKQYALAQIFDAFEEKGNAVLILRLPGVVKNEKFSLEFVSQQRFCQQEFQQWKNNVEKDGSFNPQREIKRINSKQKKLGL